MSSYNGERISTFQAGADLSTKQYHAVKFGSSDKDVVVAEATEGFGVLMNKDASSIGDACEVALVGSGAKAKIAGTVTRGASLTANATGAFVVATAGQRALAIAMASGVSGDVIPVELNLHSVPAA